MSGWLVVAWLGCSPSSEAPTPVPAPEVPAPAEVTPPADRSDLPAPSEPRYAASHVLISWAGAPRSTATRTEEEAEALARDLHAQALQGADLAAMAREHSDGASGPRGGSVGVYATETMVPSFERAVASVAVGEVAPLVRSPFGWHIARRDAVVEARAAHVLVSWHGAWRSKASRNKEEARARIEAAQAALASGQAFDAVVRTYTDDDRTREGGGDLGVVAPGQFLPPFEEALFALEPGGVSEVVETAYGFHLVRRLQ